MTFLTRSPAETLALGRLLGALAPPPPALTVIALDGPLGAGKTLLTRGMAEGAGVSDPDLVSSPTYVIMNNYPGPKPLHHLDAYRISSGEFSDLGLDELLKNENAAPATAGHPGPNEKSDALPTEVQNQSSRASSSVGGVPSSYSGASSSTHRAPMNIANENNKGDAGGIVVIEWASRISDVLPHDTLWIRISHEELDGHGDDAECRRFDFTASGPTSSVLLHNIAAALQNRTVE